MRNLFAILLLLITGTLQAQDYPFNDTNWWQRLVYEEQPAMSNLALADTTIVVATNRYKTDNTLRFMSEVRGEGELMYFFVYAYKGQWHALKTNTLQEAINHTPTINRNWVVYTEGMGKIFTSELNRGMMMNAQYGVNVIMLDYPSITTTKKLLGNYLFSMKNARAAYKDFVPILDTIKRYRQQGIMGKGNISLFYHSMGNYMARQMVKKQQLEGLNDTVWVNNMILNAACVPQRAHAKWLNKVQFAKGIYVNYNPEDGTLKWPEIMNKKKQLGRTLKQPLCSKAKYVNFNSLVGEGHSYFLSLQGREPVNSTVKKYYSALLNGQSVDLTTETYKKSSYRGIGVDMVP